MVSLPQGKNEYLPVPPPSGMAVFLQGNPILICNKDDEETKSFAYKTLEIPHTEDCLQGILTIIPLQLLSMHIAELRKCDVSITTN